MESLHGEIKAPLSDVATVQVWDAGLPDTKIHLDSLWLNLSSPKAFNTTTAKALSPPDFLRPGFCFGKNPSP